MGSRYCLPSDIVTGAATITAVAGTVDTDAHYGLAALHDENPACPCKFTDSPVVAVRLVYDFGSPQHLDGFLLPSHNLDSSLAVRFQGNTTSSWGAPPLDRAVTIVAKDRDGHSKRPWVDLSGLATHTYRYWSLYVPANSVAPKLGETLLVAAWRTFSRGIRWDLKRGVDRLALPSLTTAYGVKRYYRTDAKGDRIVGTVLGRETDLAAIRELMDDAGGPCSGFAFVLDDTTTSDGGLYVRCAESMAARHAAEWVGYDKFPFPIEFEELSRGLPL